MIIMKLGCYKSWMLRFLIKAIYMLFHVLVISGFSENDKAVGSDACNTRTGYISFINLVYQFVLESKEGKRC